MEVSKINKTLLNQNEIIDREYKIYENSFIEIKEYNKKLYTRKIQNFVEYDFNMPQTILYC